MATGETAVGRPGRRWFQFSVRTVLIAMTLFGLWFGLRMDRARRQRKAVTVLRERGNVLYESHFQGPGLSARFGKASPWGPKWLRTIVGDDFFDRVRTAWLTESPSDGTGLDLDAGRNPHYDQEEGGRQVGCGP